jgi:hypothetical protein
MKRTRKYKIEQHKLNSNDLISRSWACGLLRSGGFKPWWQNCSRCWFRCRRESSSWSSKWLRTDL